MLILDWFSCLGKSTTGYYEPGKQRTTDGHFLSAARRHQRAIKPQTSEEAEPRCAQKRFTKQRELPAVFVVPDSADGRSLLSFLFIYLTKMAAASALVTGMEPAAECISHQRVSSQYLRHRSPLQSGVDNDRHSLKLFKTFLLFFFF